MRFHFFSTILTRDTSANILCCFMTTKQEDCGLNSSLWRTVQKVMLQTILYILWWPCPSQSVMSVLFMSVLCHCRHSAYTDSSPNVLQHAAVTMVPILFIISDDNMQMDRQTDTIWLPCITDPLAIGYMHTRHFDASLGRSVASGDARCV